MAQMKCVKRTKNGVTISTKTGLPKVTSKVATQTENTFVNSDGVKITMCKPSPAPKLVTARGH
jgi:hypothetical protein